MNNTAILATLALVTALWVPNSQAADATADGVYCAKCATTWVRGKHGERGKQYTSVRRQMECPVCRNAVENFFSGGEFAHSCSTCGDLDACNAVQSKLNEDKAERAATCTKCKTTWVRTPVVGGKMTVYRSKKSMTCADCEAASQAYLATGEWKSACAACGDHLSACR